MAAKSYKSLGSVLGVLCALMAFDGFISEAEASTCRWRVKGRIVDAAGNGLANVRVKVEARWASPPGIWNDPNWPDPRTNGSGRFSVASAPVFPCSTKRDIRVKLYDGRKWRLMRRKSRRSRGTVNMGTIKARFLKTTLATAAPPLRPNCRSSMDNAFQDACRGDIGRCRGSLRFGRKAVPYFRTHALGKGHKSATRAVIVIHGNGRTGEKYFKNGLKGVARGCGLGNTVVIAPHFLAKYPWTEGDEAPEPDNPTAEQIFWPNNSGWKVGGDSSIARSPIISSFQVVDSILKQLAKKNRFPRLKTVVIIGHSAGGQFVQRYAGANQTEQKVRRLKVKYVVANPSSYAYLNRKRLKRGSTTEWTQPTDCPGYNTYKHGLAAGLNPYLSRAGASRFRSQYKRRRVVYFLGTRDTKRGKNLEKSCQADWQGRNRYKRGYNMLRFMNMFYRGHGHKLYETNAEHSGTQMLKSATGAWLMTRW